MSHSYRTLDLVRAVSFGWANHKKLTSAENQVMHFIALRGKPNEPGMAYAWFPVGGQERWAEIMAIPHSTLRNTLSSLRKKGLLINLDGSLNDSRFGGVKGYGIPLQVFEDCKEWYQSRKEMVYTRIPETLEMSELCPDPVQECPNPVQKCPAQDIHGSLTCGNALHTHIDTRRETQLLTDRARPSVSTKQMENSMRYEDEWSLPKDSLTKSTRSKPEVDDFAVPREAKEKPAPVYGPNMRLTQQFHKSWMVAREKRLNLSVDWSVQKIFQARMKSLLETHSEEQISEMIDIFFRLIDSGQIPLKADELWKDFWYNRGRLQKIAVQSSDKPTMAVSDQSELDKFRERMGR